MVEIKGKLSDLFKNVNYYPVKEMTDDILDSMIDRPIVKDSKCIGIIKHVDKDKDEWSGMLFDSTIIRLSPDMKHCQNVELKQIF